MTLVNTRLRAHTLVARRPHWPRIGALGLALVFCGGFWGLTGCALNRYAALPPHTYRTDATATVRFVSDIHAACSVTAGRLPVQRVYRGCERGGVIVLPNPCLWPNRSDYADLTCHELGHVQGWSGAHQPG
jgi:hypothetical protein